MAHPIKSVVMYATGDSVVAGLMPATSRRCCSYGFHTDSTGAASPKSA
jgi:hypothetical protein